MTCCFSLGYGGCNYGRACPQFHPYQTGGLAEAFGMNVTAQALGVNNYAAMMDQHIDAQLNANAKPARKDLTPNQIEWCRSHIPAFKPKVVT